MSSNDIHGVEKGWSVKTADGHTTGSVVETTDTYILVKSGLIINETLRYLPAATLAHVRPEMKEIGISLHQDEVEEGDWSEPPLHGPRSEGAPLNEEMYEDEEADPIAAGRARDPDRPTTL